MAFWNKFKVRPMNTTITIAIVRGFWGNPKVKMFQTPQGKELKLPAGAQVLGTMTITPQPGVWEDGFIECGAEHGE